MPQVKEFQLNMQDGSVTFEYDDGSILVGRLDTTASGGTGPAGADGKTILSGTTAPTGATGTNGDFYIRTDLLTIQGPKAAGAWPAPVSLIGPAGADGTVITVSTTAPSSPTINQLWLDIN